MILGKVFLHRAEKLNIVWESKSVFGAAVKEWKYYSGEGKVSSLGPDLSEALAKDPFKKKIIPIAVVAVLEAGEGEKAVFFKRAHDAFKGYWEFLGGSIKFGEKAEEAAAREFLEETGIKGKPQFVKYYEYVMPEHDYHRLVFLYYVRVREPICLSAEHSEMKWMKLEDFPEGLGGEPFIPLVVQEVKDLQEFLKSGSK